MPQEFTDRCMFPDHDPREDELTPDRCECGEDAMPGEDWCEDCLKGRAKLDNEKDDHDEE